MTKRIGKCTNYSSCKLAYQNEQINVVSKEFRCPDAALHWNRLAGRRIRQ